MVEKTLKKIGLSDKEAKVYLSCLRLGPSPVRKIAQESGINRGTTYDILRSLKELGLVSYYHQDKHQYFIAEDPEKLTEVIEQKQQQLEKMKGETAEIIPQLKSIYDKAGTKPVVKFYEGLSGIKTILSDLIKDYSRCSEKEYYVYSSSTVKKYIFEAYPEFSQDRVKAKIAVKVVSLGPGGQISGLDQRRWLTKKESAPTYTLIYPDKVAIISVDHHNQPIGVVIWDHNIYKTQKMMFEFIWEKL